MARTTYLKPKIYNKLYACMQYENALALRTSLETGWRIDDVLHLRVEDLRGRTLHCVAMKTGKPDKKVISADLAKRLLQVARNGRFFDGRFGNKPRTRQTVWRDVKKAAKILQIKGNVAPHTARKTYAVEDFKENGLAAVQKDLQHDRVGTTVLYAFADLIDAQYGAPQILRSIDTASAETAELAKSECDVSHAALALIRQTAAEVGEQCARRVLGRIEPLILGLTEKL